MNFSRSKPWKGKEPPVFSGKPADFSGWCFAMEEVLVVVPQNDQVRFVVSYLAADAGEMVYDNLLSLRTSSAERLVFFAKRAASGFFSRVRESLSSFQTSKDTAGWGTGGLQLRNSKVSVFYLQEWTTLTQAILFTEGLKPSVRRVVIQAHAETLQAAMRAARAA